MIEPSARLFCQVIGWTLIVFSILTAAAVYIYERRKGGKERANRGNIGG